MKKDYVQARTIMLGESLGVPILAAEVTPTQPIRVLTENDLDDQDHDIKLVVAAMEGHSNEEAAEIFDQLRPKFRLDAFRNASPEEVSSYF